MNTVKKSVFAVGVALSVTPFFHSALAQSSNNSGSVLREMQILRDEVAELRDMVERQQYEMRKLKQAQERAQASRSNPSRQYGDNSQAQQYGQSDSGQISQTQSAAGGLIGVPGQSAPDQSGVVAGDRQIYQQGGYAGQYQDAQSGNSSVGSERGEYGAEVLDRTVNVDRGSTQDTYPPVLERVVNPNSGQTAGGVISVPGAQGVIAESQDQDTALNQPEPATGQQQAAPKSGEADQALTIGGALSAIGEDQYYDRGFDLLKQAKYDDAVAVFKEQITQYPRGDLADDAHYWIAEAMFISRRPIDAKPHLRAIIDNYPQSTRLPDAMLKTAYIEQEVGNVIEARILFQEILNQHPSSNAAIAAKNRLAILKGAR